VTVAYLYDQLGCFLPSGFPLSSALLLTSFPGEIVEVSHGVSRHESLEPGEQRRIELPVVKPCVPLGMFVELEVESVEICLVSVGGARCTVASWRPAAEVRIHPGRRERWGTVLCGPKDRVSVMLRNVSQSPASVQIGLALGRPPRIRLTGMETSAEALRVAGEIAELVPHDADPCASVLTGVELVPVGREIEQDRCRCGKGTAWHVESNAPADYWLLGILLDAKAAPYYDVEAVWVGDHQRFWGPEPAVKFTTAEPRARTNLACWPERQSLTVVLRCKENWVEPPIVCAVVTHWNPKGVA
jgi:hypothetical protein